MEKKEQYERWQTMDATVWEIDRVTLDGVLFRSEKCQNNKNNGTVTDNSVLTGETEVVREGVTTKERCYGIAETFYLHFMYPSDPARLKQATTKRRINPAQVGVPWAVFAKCRWYEQLPDKHPPHNGLTQCIRNVEWDECALIAMQNCFAMNCVLWPSQPINDDLYQQDGSLKANMTHMNWDDEFLKYCVITHHESHLSDNVHACMHLVHMHLYMYII